MSFSLIRPLKPLRQLLSLVLSNSLNSTKDLKILMNLTARPHWISLCSQALWTHYAKAWKLIAFSFFPSCLKFGQQTSHQDSGSWSQLTQDCSKWRWLLQKGCFTAFRTCLCLCRRGLRTGVHLLFDCQTSRSSG